MKIVYFSEIVILFVCILVEPLVTKIKYKKIDTDILCIILTIFIAIIGLTYIFEVPQIEIDHNLNIEINSENKIEKPKAYYHFLNETSNLKMSNNINYKKLGSYEINLEMNTLIGKYKKRVIVNVVDTQKPELTLGKEAEFKQPYYIEYSEPGFKAIDSFEGDLTKNVKVEKEVINEDEYNLIYTVKDSSGNEAKQIRRVIITDDVKPEISLNGESNMLITLNEKYTEEGATAQDAKDGDITNKIEIEGKVDTTKEGTYYISYKAKDKSLNEAIKKRIVIVKKAENLNTNIEGEIGIIFLTFDDGPSNNITPQVLDILKENNIKATFFLINYNDEKENTVKREYEEGHSIGIHGYSHNYQEIYTSEEAYMDNLKKLQEKINHTTGYTTYITRFPGGSSNTISEFNKGIMTRLTQLVVESGYKYYDWNVSSEDAVGASTPDELYNNVIEGLSKGKRNFVLMHDFDKNEAIIEALPKIIQYGNENGYVFEKITEETPMITHRVFN